MFADDTTSPAEFQSATEVNTYLNIFQLAKLITGLEINPKKTQILSLKCSPVNLPPTQKHILNKIGNVTEQVNHLGIIVTNNWANSAAASWQNSLTNFIGSADKFRTITGSENPLHKKQLAAALLQSTFNHVLRVHAPTQSLLKKFESTIIDAIWTKKYCGQTYGRVKIAASRISDPISRGGLGFKPIQEQALASMISGGFNILQFCIENPNTFMAKEINLDINELCRSGSQNVEYLKSLFAKMFPTIAPIGDFDLISKFRDVLALLEKDTKYFFRAPLSNNSIFGHFDLDIVTLLNIDSKGCIGSLLKTTGPGLPETSWSDQIQTKMLELNNYDRTIMNNVLVKLKSVSPICPALLKKLSTQKTTNFFYAAIQENSFFTKALKYLRNIKATKIPPAYATRVRDNIPVPNSPALFSKVYRVLNNYTIPASSHWKALEFLNRTKSTPKLKFNAKISNDPYCKRCKVVGDNFHFQKECIVAYMSIEAFTSFFRKFYPKIEFQPFNFVYFLPIESKNSNFNSQFTHLFIELQSLSYEIQDEPRLNRFNPLHFYAKMLTIISSTVTIRKLSRWSFTEIDNFRNHFISLMDIASIRLYPPDDSHFRDGILRRQD